LVWRSIKLVNAKLVLDYLLVEAQSLDPTLMHPKLFPKDGGTAAHPRPQSVSSQRLILQVNV
jgi:hypothetical protein